MEMEVRIDGKSVKVTISSDGIFYIANNSSIHSNSLRGLIDKLRLKKANFTIPIGLRVQNEDGSKVGRLIAKVSESSYQVLWDGGKRVSVVYEASLYREFTQMERDHIQHLRAEAATTLNASEALETSHIKAYAQLEKSQEIELEKLEDSQSLALEKADTAANDAQNALDEFFEERGIRTVLNPKNNKKA